MFSCSHFSNFLSDPIGKQSAMSKRGQEATSGTETNGSNEDVTRQLGVAQPVDEGQGSQTCTRRLVQTATPRTVFQNVKYTNHQYITEVFHFLQKKLEITAGLSTLSVEALETNVLMWGVFISSSMKAVIHLGPNCLANLEVHKNTNF